MEIDNCVQAVDEWVCGKIPSLNSMIGKVVHSNHRDWDERLPSIMAAYRAARHESTGYSPNFLVLGRENRALLDIILGDTPE